MPFHYPLSPYSGQTSGIFNAAPGGSIFPQPAPPLPPVPAPPLPPVPAPPEDTQASPSPDDAQAPPPGARVEESFQSMRDLMSAPSLSDFMDYYNSIYGPWTPGGGLSNLPQRPSPGGSGLPTQGLETYPRGDFPWGGYGGLEALQTGQANFQGESPADVMRFFTSTVPSGASRWQHQQAGREAGYAGPWGAGQASDWFAQNPEAQQAFQGLLGQTAAQRPLDYPYESMPWGGYGSLQNLQTGQANFQGAAPTDVLSFFNEQVGSGVSRWQHQQLGKQAGYTGQWGGGQASEWFGQNPQAQQQFQDLLGQAAASRPAREGLDSLIATGAIGPIWGGPTTNQPPMAPWTPTPTVNPTAPSDFFQQARDEIGGATPDILLQRLAELGLF